MSFNETSDCCIMLSRNVYTDVAIPITQGMDIYVNELIQLISSQVDFCDQMTSNFVYIMLLTLIYMYSEPPQ